MNNVCVSARNYVPVTATTAEESIKIAMYGAAYVAVPANLVGCKDRSGAEMIETVYEPEIELAVPADETILTVEEDVILEDVTSGGELNEVIHFTEDEDGVVSVLIRDESSRLFYVAEGDWAVFYGEEGELELLSAYDKAIMRALRKSFALV
jgi:hypothetical protein